jgi:1,5-anhydro-D-fructose reductase (1,5-anhydro-D-mannitol-forming)
MPFGASLTPDYGESKVKIRTAWLSFWHAHAVGTATRNYQGLGAVGKAKANPDLDLLISWDEDAERGRELAPAAGLPFEEDYDKILAREDIDAVMVNTSTTLHGEVIKKAVRAGKHIFTNKVLTPTTKEANEVLRAVEESGVIMMVDLKHTSFDYVLRTKEILASGELGKVVNVRMMQAHGMAIRVSPVDNFGEMPPGFFRKSEGGGGVHTDICHPMYVLPHLFGMPETVFAHFGSITGKGDVEDNSIVIYGYPDGSHASIESAWTTLASPGGLLEVNGTVGSLVFRANTHPSWGAPKDYLFEKRGPNDVHFQPVDLGKSLPFAMETWIEHVKEGKKNPENLALALDLTRLVEAANLSAERGMPIKISSLAE